MGSRNKVKAVKKLKHEKVLKGETIVEKKEAKEHIGTLRRLQEKDPDFYEFLKEHDKDLLEFDEEDVNDDMQTDAEDEVDTDVYHIEHSDGEVEKEEKDTKNVVTSAMVDLWCNEIHDGAKIGAVRSLLRAFRTACHYGDEGIDEPTTKYNTMSSIVFNKVMLFVLTEMDGILRELLKLPPSGGKKELVLDLMKTRRWKNYNNLVKSYLGNSLHVLNQMTDNEMIAFMLRRLRYSCIFLAAFPVLLRKYVKVALHFWGSGSGALPVFSFLFLRDCSIRLGSDCLDDCIRGMYKSFVMNCHNITPSKLQHIQFRSNCFIELTRVDTPSTYQHAFVYIRQLAIVLKEALSCSTRKNFTKNKGREAPPSSKKGKSKDTPSSNTNKKEMFRKVYQWKYMNCLELWTAVVFSNGLDADLSSLAYPLTQIITGAARLLPSACYFPLRLRCIRMLNRISSSTGSFIPLSLLLLDMLDMKELRRPTTGLGKAVDLGTVLKVSKSTLTTRVFQEACVFSVIEELTEHLAQWSYSLAFLEFSVIPSVRLRAFCKSTKVERFRQEVRSLIRQIEANSDFINKKRASSELLPNDLVAPSFLENEKKLEVSPLSRYLITLRQRASERNDALTESSALVGERSSISGNKVTEDDDSDHEESIELLLPGGGSRSNVPKNVVMKKYEDSKATALDEDIIEDLILSSEEDSLTGVGYEEEEGPSETSAASKQHNKKRKKAFGLQKERGVGGHKKAKKNKWIKRNS